MKEIWRDVVGYEGYYRLYRVVLPYACYGVIVSNCKIKGAPPIAAWAIGKRFTWFCEWVALRSGTVIPIKE